MFKAEDLLLASVINNETVNDLVITNEFRFILDRQYINYILSSIRKHFVENGFI